MKRVNFCLDDKSASDLSLAADLFKLNKSKFLRSAIEEYLPKYIAELYGEEMSKLEKRQDDIRKILNRLEEH